jgi:hypothetical protein
MDTTTTDASMGGAADDRTDGSVGKDAGTGAEDAGTEDAMSGDIVPTAAGVITDSHRATMLRAALARLGREELRQALSLAIDPGHQIPKAAANALNALRKHRDPASVVDKLQYRVALPYVAAVVSDACLTRTIELLGDHSDDPTREQLLTAIEAEGDEFSVATVAVMLATVADGDMASSDLCFELLATDERFGLTGWAELDASPGSGTAAGAKGQPRADGPSPEQREARRLKKQKDAEERRKKLEAARRAGEEVRRARKKERLAGAGAPTPKVGPSPAESTSGVAPRLTRRALLTPAQELEFDRSDPWVAGVVFAWVPFDPTAIAGPQVEGENGKTRRCVVVAGSATHLLVRPGFSEGGLKSRDWKSVPLAHWRRSGFDQPTWIDVDVLRVPRDPEQAPVGWLSGEDWNDLW